jgi:hypothetical protein
MDITMSLQIKIQFEGNKKVSGLLVFYTVLSEVASPSFY